MQIEYLVPFVISISIALQLLLWICCSAVG